MDLQFELLDRIDEGVGLNRTGDQVFLKRFMGFLSPFKQISG
jgi:hypothetical protein